MAKTKTRCNNPVLALGAVAMSLVCPCAAMTLVSSLVLLFEKYVTFTCGGALSLLSCALALSAFISGILGIVKDKKCALISVVLFGVSSVFAFIALGITGINNLGVDELYNDLGTVVKALNITSGVLLICAIPLISFYYLNAPKKTEYFKDEVKTPLSMSAAFDMIAKLNTFRKFNEMSEDEFASRKSEILDAVFYQPQNKPACEKATVKKTLLCMLLPIVAVIVCVAVILPSMYVGIRNSLYNELTVAMQDVHWYSSEYSEDNSNIEQYLKQLPHDYKNMPFIIIEYNRFKSYRQTVENNEAYTSSKKLRNAYVSMVNMQNTSKLFNFNIESNPKVTVKLISDIKWKTFDDMSQLVFSENDCALNLQTNIPEIGTVNANVFYEELSDGTLLVELTDNLTKTTLKFSDFEVLDYAYFILKVSVNDSEGQYVYAYETYKER